MDASVLLRIKNKILREDRRWEGLFVSQWTERPSLGPVKPQCPIVVECQGGEEGVGEWVGGAPT